MLFLDRTTMTQKDQELAIVTPLLEEYGFTLIDRKENERPDFVASNKQGIIVGIEVTEVRDHSKGQIEASEKVIDQLLNKYTESRKGLYSGTYSVRINQSLIHNGERIKPLERQLFSELDRFLVDPTAEGVIVERVTRIVGGPLNVAREPGHSTWIHALPQQLLDNTIANKANKLIEYQSLPQNIHLKIREYWLVILVPAKEGWEVWAGQRPNVPSGYSRIYISDGFKPHRIQ